MEGGAVVDGSGRERQQKQKQKTKQKTFFFSRMSYIEEIRFVDAQTNEPLVTITGDNAKFLVERSGLVQNLIEITENAKKNKNKNKPKNSKNVKPEDKILTIPIGEFPADRKKLFVDILSGKPVGLEFTADEEGDYGQQQEEGYRFYPLGPQEERNIRTAVNTETLNDATRDLKIQKERQKAIYETMRYLLLDDKDIAKILEFENIRELEGPTEISNRENEIDSLLEVHKMWLFTSGQASKLTKENRNAIKTELDKKQKNWEELRSNSYGNYSENSPLDSRQYQPVEPSITASMWPKEYERWLRTGKSGGKRKTRKARKQRRGTRRQRK